MLADGHDRCQLRSLAHCVQQILLPLGGQGSLQQRNGVKVVLDGLLAARGHQDDLIHAGGDHLFDTDLNERAIHDGEQDLGEGFGGREHARTAPGDRKDCPAHLHWGLLSWGVGQPTDPHHPRGATVTRRGSMPAANGSSRLNISGIISNAATSNQ